MDKYKELVLTLIEQWALEGALYIYNNFNWLRGKDIDEEYVVVIEDYSVYTDQDGIYGSLIINKKAAEKLLEAIKALSRIGFLKEYHENEIEKTFYWLFNKRYENQIDTIHGQEAFMTPKEFMYFDIEDAERMITIQKFLEEIRL